MDNPSAAFGQTNAIRLSDEDAVVAVLERSLTGLWSTVNELTRLRRSRRSNYRVAIFGSARIQPGTPDYENVKRLAAELTGLGCDIISGGGPGLMQAANEGAHAAEPDAPHRSLGINIELPFEQSVNPYVGRAYEHGTFFSRLHHFMIAADAFIAVPGGIGTLLEMSLAWQLLQVQKLQGTPLILMGAMWEELVEWGRRSMLEPGAELASPRDFDIPRIARTHEEAVSLIRASRDAWLQAQPIL